MDARTRSSWAAVSGLVLVLVVILSGAEVSGASSNVHRSIGVRFLSFSYTSGRLPDGSCCDGGSMMGGSCPLDTCDTSFVFCLTHQSNGRSCDPYLETSPLVDNNTVAKFGSEIDPKVGNATRSLFAISVSTMEDIQVQVKVQEVDPGSAVQSSSVPLGNFSLLLNTTHLFTRTPDWQTFHFQNSVIRLSLNVTSYCAHHYYGTSCDVFCSRSRHHYTCDNNGAKICDKGYEGADCNTVTDLCVSQPCRNNSPCQKRVNDFFCDCTPGFTGKTCDSVVPVTTSPSPGQPTSRQAPQNSATHPITTTTTTTTTTNNNNNNNNKTGSSSSSAQKNNSPGGTNIGVIVGPVVAVLLLLLIAALLFFLWFDRKRKRTVEPEEEKGEEESPERAKNDALNTAGKTPVPIAPLATQVSTKGPETSADVKLS